MSREKIGKRTTNHFEHTHSLKIREKGSEKPFDTFATTTGTPATCILEIAGVTFSWCHVVQTVTCSLLFDYV